MISKACRNPDIGTLCVNGMIGEVTDFIHCHFSYHVTSEEK